MKPTDILDLPELVARLGGDLDLLTELTEVYFATCPALLDRLAKASQSGDCKTVFDAAHEIKGMVGNLSAKRAYRSADEVIAAAEAGAIELLVPLSSQLILEVRLLMPLFRELLDKAQTDDTFRAAFRRSSK